MEMLELQNTFIIMVVTGVCVAIIVFFITTLQNTLKLTAPESRRMQTGFVWLLLVPVFGLIWAFVVVNAIGKSCQAQLTEYGVYYNRKSATNLGNVWALVRCSVY